MIEFLRRYPYHIASALGGGFVALALLDLPGEPANSPTSPHIVVGTRLPSGEPTVPPLPQHGDIITYERQNTQPPDRLGRIVIRFHTPTATTQESPY